MKILVSISLHPQVVSKGIPFNNMVKINMHSRPCHGLTMCLGGC